MSQTKHCCSFEVKIFWPLPKFRAGYATATDAERNFSSCGVGILSITWKNSGWRCTAILELTRLCLNKVRQTKWRLLRISHRQFFVRQPCLQYCEVSELVDRFRNLCNIVHLEVQLRDVVRYVIDWYWRQMTASASHHGSWHTEEETLFTFLGEKSLKHDYLKKHTGVWRAGGFDSKPSPSSRPSRPPTNLSKPETFPESWADFTSRRAPESYLHNVFAGSRAQVAASTARRRSMDYYHSPSLE